MRGTSLGVALKIGATLAFSLMYVAVRLAGSVPTGQVIFFRAFFALVPLFLVSVFTVGPRAVVHTTRPLMHVLRSLTGVTSMFLNFAAVKMLPLADLTGFSFVMPIVAVVLAALMLHERVGPYRSGAVVIGFAGVILMAEPHGGLLNLLAPGHSAGAALALMGASLSAFVVIFIRQMSTTERSEAIVFYFMTITAIVGAISMLWWRVPLTVEMTFWLVMSGILGGIGQVAMTYSYRFAEPSLLAPFDYVAMVWAVALGFLVFGEVPERLVIAGAGVVIASGLFILWRERNLGDIEPAAS
jgi:drug/metabolite transporter (DMT)-like permease